MQRRLPDACVFIGQRKTHSRTRRFGLDAGQCPHSVAPDTGRSAVCKSVSQGTDRFAFRQCGDGPLAYGRALVVKQFG